MISIVRLGLPKNIPELPNIYTHSAIFPFLLVIISLIRNRTLQKNLYEAIHLSFSNVIYLMAGYSQM